MNDRPGCQGKLCPGELRGEKAHRFQRQSHRIITMTTVTELGSHNKDEPLRGAARSHGPELVGYPRHLAGERLGCCPSGMGEGHSWTIQSLYPYP